MHLDRKNTKEKLKAYIIGVKGNHRNPSLLKDLSMLELEIVVEDGFVDKSNVSLADVDETTFSLIRGRAPQLTEIACAKAHLIAWKYLVDSEESSLAIFEDDAVLIDEEGFRRTKLESEELVGPWALSLERRQGDFLVSHFLRLRRRLRKSLVQPTGACAYIISREAAKIGLNYFSDRRGRIDGLSDFWPGPAALFRWNIAVPPVFEASTSVSSLIGYEAPHQRKLPKLWAMLLLLFSKPYDGVLVAGSFILLVVKPIKYLFSVHFLTAWIMNKRRGSRKS